MQFHSNCFMYNTICLYDSCQENNHSKQLIMTSTT